MIAVVVLVSLSAICLSVVDAGLQRKKTRGLELACEHAVELRRIAEERSERLGVLLSDVRIEAGQLREKLHEFTGSRTRVKKLEHVLAWLFNHKTQHVKTGQFIDLYKYKGIEAALSFFDNDAELTPEQKISNGIARVMEQQPRTIKRSSL